MDLTETKHVWSVSLEGVGVYLELVSNHKESATGGPWQQVQEGHLSIIQPRYRHTCDWVDCCAHQMQAVVRLDMLGDKEEICIDVTMLVECI